jgi:hypothetical protein
MLEEFTVVRWNKVSESDMPRENGSIGGEGASGLAGLNGQG